MVDQEISALWTAQNCQNYAPSKCLTHLLDVALGGTGPVQEHT